MLKPATVPEPDQRLLMLRVEPFVYLSACLPDVTVYLSVDEVT